jgi:hypothetical protein
MSEWKRGGPAVVEAGDGGGGGTRSHEALVVVRCELGRRCRCSGDDVVVAHA